jgi:hypothetical protein
MADEARGELIGPQQIRMFAGRAAVHIYASFRLAAGEGSTLLDRLVHTSRGAAVWERHAHSLATPKPHATPSTPGLLQTESPGPTLPATAVVVEKVPRDSAGLWRAPSRDLHTG